MHLPKFELHTKVVSNTENIFCKQLQKRNIVFTELIVKNFEYLNENNVRNKHKVSTQNV